MRVPSLPEVFTALMMAGCQPNGDMVPVVEEPTTESIVAPDGRGIQQENSIMYDECMAAARARIDLFKAENPITCANTYLDDPECFSRPWVRPCMEESGS